MEIKPVIMVVEDEKAISDFLVVRLESEGYRTIAVYNGREAASLAASHCPDLILLDLGLPDIDGLEVLAAVREWSAMPVVVVSARQRDEDIVEALDKGADDYICKPFSNSVLMARIRAALRGKASLPEERSQARPAFGGGILRIDYAKRMVTAGERTVHLTPIEYKMLAYLSRNAGKVVTYAALRRELWGPYAGDNRTLRVNMTNLRRKIESDSANPRYILTEAGVGYRMMDADKPEALT